MLTRSLFLTVTLVSLVAGRAFAQAPISNPLGDKVSFAAAFGGLSGAADLGTSAQWKLGWAGSVDATYWVQPNIGLRASGSWAQDSLRATGLSGRGKFNKFGYDAALVLRYPLIHTYVTREFG